MALRVLCLGKLADLAGDDLILPLDAPLDWPALVAALPPELAEAVQGPKVCVALNGALLADKTTLAAKPGDEIALLPPVSGG